MKKIGKIFIGTLIFLATTVLLMGEPAPIYEYRSETLKRLDEQMNNERDRNRLKKLNTQYEIALNEYIESTNRNSNVIFQLGDQYFRMNQLERAEKIFSMDNKDIRNLFGSATSLRFLGKNQEAISKYNEVLDINPSFYEAYLGRGIANRNLKNYDSAISDFREYLEYKKDEYVYAGIGDIYMATDRYVEAKTILEQGRATFPNSKVLRELLSKVYGKVK